MLGLTRQVHFPPPPGMAGMHTGNMAKLCEDVQWGSAATHPCKQYRCVFRYAGKPCELDDGRMDSMKSHEAWGKWRGEQVCCMAMSSYQLWLSVFNARMHLSSHRSMEQAWLLSRRAARTWLPHPNALYVASSQTPDAPQAFPVAATQRVLLPVAVAFEP